MCACLAPPGTLVLKLALPVSRELSFLLLWIHFGSTLIFLWEERYVDILWMKVVFRRLLCLEQLCIVQNYVPPSCSVAKHTPREARCSRFLWGWQRSPLQDENIFT